MTWMFWYEMIDELSFWYQYLFFSGVNFTEYPPSLFLVRLLAGASFFIAVKNGVSLFLLNSKYLKWISDLYREVSLFAEWIINASNAILKRRFLTEEEKFLNLDVWFVCSHQSSWEFSLYCLLFQYSKAKQQQRREKKIFFLVCSEICGYHVFERCWSYSLC